MLIRPAPPRNFAEALFNLLVIELQQREGLPDLGILLEHHQFMWDGAHTPSLSIYRKRSTDDSEIGFHVLVVRANDQPELEESDYFIKFIGTRKEGDEYKPVWLQEEPYDREKLGLMSFAVANFFLDKSGRFKNIDELNAVLYPAYGLEVPASTTQPAIVL